MQSYRSRACGTPHRLLSHKEHKVNILFVIIIVVAVILAITGGLVQSLNFLLWVGVVLLALAVIAWLIRAITGKKVG